VLIAEQAKGSVILHKEDVNLFEPLLILAAVFAT
jgi:hypothetical protein